jgi:hypothetical protein
MSLSLPQEESGFEVLSRRIPFQKVLGEKQKLVGVLPNAIFMKIPK